MAPISKKSVSMHKPITLKLKPAVAAYEKAKAELTAGVQIKELLSLATEAAKEELLAKEVRPVDANQLEAWAIQLLGQEPQNPASLSANTALALLASQVCTASSHTCVTSCPDSSVSTDAPIQPNPTGVASWYVDHSFVELDKAGLHRQVSICPRTGLTTIYFDTLGLGQGALPATSLHPLFVDTSKSMQGYRSLMHNKRSGERKDVPKELIAADILYHLTDRRQLGEHFGLLHSTAQMMVLCNQALCEFAHSELVRLHSACLESRYKWRKLSCVELFNALNQYTSEQNEAYIKRFRHTRLAVALYDFIQGATEKAVEHTAQQAAERKADTAHAAQSEYEAKLGRMIASLSVGECLGNRREWANVLRPTGDASVKRWKEVNKLLSADITDLSADSFKEVCAFLQEQDKLASLPKPSELVIPFAQLTMQSKARYRKLTQVMLGLYQAKLDKELHVFCSELDLVEIAKSRTSRTVVTKPVAQVSASVVHPSDVEFVDM